VDGLEVPDTLPGLDIQRHQAFGKQVVAVTRASLVVAGRRLDRQIHVAEFFVRRHRRPDGNVSGGTGWVEVFAGGRAAMLAGRKRPDAFAPGLPSPQTRVSGPLSDLRLVQNRLDFLFL
jgi:hypothetical protein